MTANHQWTTFQKGRLKIKACGCCGEMSLPSNAQSVCEQHSMINSPMIKAGYKIAAHLPKSTRMSAFSVSL